MFLYNNKINLFKKCMFQISKIVVIIALLYFAPSNASLKGAYEWDEYIRVCSSNLSDMVKAICSGDYITSRKY